MRLSNPTPAIDPFLDQAIREIYADDGVRVRPEFKNKTLNKYGKNVDLSTIKEEVWARGGVETLPTTNAIDTISSSNSGDSQDVIVEGHTVDGSGNLTFVVQTATLNGQNKVTLGTPLARSTRIKNNDSDDFAGTVYVYEDDTLTAGVPQTEAKIHLQTDGNSNQSLKCATSVSQFDYWIITALTLGVNRQQTRNVDFELQVREKGKVFRVQSPPVSLASQSGGIHVPLHPYLIVKPNSDVRMMAVSSGASTQVEATIHGILLKAIS